MYDFQRHQGIANAVKAAAQKFEADATKRETCLICGDLREGFTSCFTITQDENEDFHAKVESYSFGPAASKWIEVLIPKGGTIGADIKTMICPDCAIKKDLVSPESENLEGSPSAAIELSKLETASLLTPPEKEDDIPF